MLLNLVILYNIIYEFIRLQYVLLFFAYLIHYIIKGYNQMKDHGKPCKTLYIPEDFDLNVALDTVTGLSRINLERRDLN